MKHEQFEAMNEMTEDFKAGWNYRCSYVPGGKYKMPKGATKEFKRGFDECNAAFNKATADAIRTGTNPVYPQPK